MKQSEVSHKRINWNVVCGWSILAAVVILWISILIHGLVFYDEPTIPSQTAQPAEQVSEPTPILELPVGMVGWLGVNDVSFLLVAKTMDDHNTYCGILDAQDKQGMAEMILKGQLLKVDSRTDAKVLTCDSWNGVCKVRILEGRHTGEIGYVFTATIHPK